MKRSVFILFASAIIALGLASCEGKNVYSPSLQAASRMIRTSVDGVQDTILLSDSISVGDTVRMGLLAQGYFHYLTSFVAKSDESMLISLAWNEADSAALAPGSDPQNGKIYFAPNAAYVFYTTMRLTPRQSGTHHIEMTVASNAGTPYSPQTYSYDLRVK